MNVEREADRLGVETVAVTVTVFGGDAEGVWVARGAVRDGRGDALVVVGAGVATGDSLDEVGDVATGVEVTALVTAGTEVARRAGLAGELQAVTVARISAATPVRVARRLVRHASAHRAG